MTVPGLNQRRVRRLEERVTEGQGLGEGGSLTEDPGVRADPDDAGQHLRRDAVGVRTIDHRLQPRTIFRMTGRVPPEGIDEDVDVRQDHRMPPRRSSTSPVSSGWVPGQTAPVAFDVGSLTRAERAVLCEPEMASRSPRSIKLVNVSPRLRASCLAFVSRPGSSLTVVRMPERTSQTYVCQKPPRIAHSFCFSCRRASSSATTSKSFGRPAARFTRISASSPRHWQLT